MTLTGTTTPNQSGLGSNSNKGVMDIPQSSRPEPSSWFSAISRTLIMGREGLSLSRDAVGVLYKYKKNEIGLLIHCNDFDYIS